MCFLDSALCCNMHTKLWFQKLREFWNNQVIDVYEFEGMLVSTNVDFLD